MQKLILVGNANTGKTTLLNNLTKSNEHVGNWHGVTVENKSKTFEVNNEKFELWDIPGIYSLEPNSFEEEVAVNFLFQEKNAKILNICDLENLERNLYLTLCLLEKGFDMLLVINQLSKKAKVKVDTKKLSFLLGVPVVILSAQDKSAKNEIYNACQKEVSPKKPKYLENSEIKNLIENHKKIDYLNENSLKTDKKLEKTAKTENFCHDEILKIAKIRYDYIETILKECVVKEEKVYGKSKLDKIILNKFLAFPIFIIILSLVFYLTFFSLGAFLLYSLVMGLESILSPIQAFLKANLSGSFICDLLSEAVFGGLITLVGFLPQIALLFFFLTCLEDSGYLARIAFVFDDILSKVGLSGKSVYTLLMGFGCSTSAVMTARNMQDKNSKIKTALACPYMSCSAKFPIYSVVGGAFFGANNLFVILGLYLLGVVVAILCSLILDKTLLKSQKQTFILEFPPYKVISFKRAVKVLWENMKSFLVRVTSVLISMNIIIWVLSNFSFNFKYVGANGGSMLESFSKILAPIFAPIGLNNWAIVASLLAGLVAKEIVVSSIAMLNGIDAGATNLVSSSLLQPASLVFFASNAQVVSFLVFCLLYFPCVATISVMLKEVGKKWTLLGILIEFLVAYIIAFLAFNITLLFEMYGMASVSILLGALLFTISLIIVFKHLKRPKCSKNCQNCAKNCKK